VVGGRRRIAALPPIVVPIEDLLPEAPADEVFQQMQNLIEGYSQSLPPERRRLLAQFLLVHMARKVVGVGSLGTHAWVLLFLGRDDSDPLFLQAKEAQASVLEDYVGASEYARHGERVVAGQRTMQASGTSSSEAVQRRASTVENAIATSVSCATGRAQPRSK
jgi:uncharacterized protein (DUF2252 family)